jgi:restriction system protein
MAIPDYQSLMLPLLRLLEDGQEHTVREAIDKLANEFDLTEEERKALLPSGRQTVFRNRVSWASTYLNKAGVIESPRRGHMQITDRGKEVLKQNPQKNRCRISEPVRGICSISRHSISIRFARQTYCADSG